MSRRGLVAACRNHPDLVVGGGIVLIALGLRRAFFFRAPPLLVLRDSASYALPALDLVQGVGVGFDPELKRPPLYPLFLAVSFWILGEDLGAPLLLQHLLGVLGVALTYALARRLWGRPAAVLAGLMGALSGGLLFIEHSIMAEALFALLLVATLLAATSVRGARPVRWALASGVLLGLATLTRPGALVLAPLLAPLLAWLAAATLRRRMLVGAALLVGCLGTVLPWMVRNQVVHGAFTVAGGTGEALVSRTSRHDRGFGHDAYVFRGEAAHLKVDDGYAAARRWVYRQLARTDEADLLVRGLRREFGLSQTEADRLLREIAVHAIQQDAGRYLLVSAQMGIELFVSAERRLGTAWDLVGKPKLHEDWGTRATHLLGPPTAAQQRERPTAELLLDLHDHRRIGGLLAVLFTIGTATTLVSARFRPALPSAVAVVVLLGTSVALAGPLFRYRASVEPLIAVVAVGGLVGIWELGRALFRAWPIRHRPPRRSEAMP